MVIRLSSEKHNPSFDNDRLDIIHVVIECGAGFVWESKLVKKIIQIFLQSTRIEFQILLTFHSKESNQTTNYHGNRIVYFSHLFAILSVRQNSLDD